MLRRYLVALVGAVIGGGAVFAVYHFSYYFQPDYRVVGAGALAVAGFLMAKGEDLGLVPPSEEIGRPTSIFDDDKGRRR